MKGHRALPAGLLVVLTIAVYWNALHSPFAYDDWQLIVNNPSIRDWRHWRYVLVGSQRPLVNYSFAVNWALSRDAPFGFHLTNLLIHAVNVLLLFRLASARTAVAVGAAGLLAVHPLLTESVSFVGARAGLLCTTFLLLGTLAFARAAASGRRRFLVAAVAAWLAALACKETAVVLPVTWLAWDRWVAAGEPDARRRRLWRFHVPTLVLMAAAAVARLAIHSRYEQASSRTHVLHLVGQAEVIWRYLFLFVAPISQTVRHSVPAAPPWHAWPAAAGLLLLAALAMRARHAAPLVAFGAVWFFLFILPSSVIPLIEPMAEHRVYEASAGLFLVAALGLERLPRRAWAPVVIALLAALSAGTLARNRVWADPIALWSEAVRASPDDWASHYALGDALREADDCARAEPEYRRAMMLQRNEARPRTNLGICLAELGRLDEAEAELKTARRMDPRSAPIVHDLGELERRRGRLNEARAWFHEALALVPDYAPSRSALAELDAAAPAPSPAPSPSPSP